MLSLIKPTYQCTLLSLLCAAAFSAPQLALGEENNPFDGKPLETLIAQAEQGNTKAQAELSIRYGDAGNYADAFKWAQPAAEKGDAEAQFNLGWLYENGQGVTQDYNKACQWYEKAAAQGLAKAQQALEELQQKGY
ncbi:tetratricopeptide repeat protein [Suttonella ornithocola]|uniref:Sel1 repeat n=1 Tax=Suttonella ornithocola TaxID=279832 RepID=A0A380MV64_9GAMM|nr:tetratricopeptide repeat protein [Suttonella ornithocola]SUO96074.1 Sel1 repeat [Suttonella ornithocola]